jgi:hypothetical protein
MNISSKADSSSTSPAHIDPSVYSLLGESDSTRIQYIMKDRIIMYTQFKRIANQVGWMMREPIRTRARGLVVRGEPGFGKTTLGEFIQSRYPRRLDKATKKPLPFAVTISMSGARDARTIYNRILETLKVPVAAYYRVADRELTVLRVLREINCRMLVLDEAQDIVNGSEREQIRALEAVKLLTNELHFPIVALGTKDIESIFRADEHLAARFSSTSLPGWKRNGELLDFLAAYERTLPLRRPSGLASPVLVKALLKQSDGVLDHILRVLRFAAVYAIESGEERITLANIAAAEEFPDFELLEDAA